MTVGRHYLDKGYHLYYDNFFSSVALSEELLERKTHSCSTIRTNRKGWPKDCDPKKTKLKKGEVKMRQKGGLLATLWQDKRSVTILSTNVNPQMGSALRRTKQGD